MPIKTRCQCGAAFAAPDKLAGKRVKCPKCADPVMVPVEKSADSKNKIRVACACGKALQVPAAYAGKKVKCPDCGQSVLVAAQQAAAATDDIGNLLDEVDLGVSATGRRCPECRADVSPDDVLCVKCGFNLETGKKLKTKLVDAKSRDPVAIAMEAAKSGKQKADTPKAVESLAKTLNQVGTLAVVAAALFIGFKCYQAMQGTTKFNVDQVIGVLTGSGGMVLGVVVVLVVVPCAIAANLVQKGHPAGRMLSMVMGVIGLAGLITTIPALLALKLASSDEVARFCR